MFETKRGKKRHGGRGTKAANDSRVNRHENTGAGYGLPPSLPNCEESNERMEREWPHPLQ